MKLQRVDLLKRLLAVSPGLTPQDTTSQSSCVVFRKGRLYTLNREIACSITSNMDEACEGAIAARKLIDLLKKLPEDDIQLEVQKDKLIIKGPRKVSKLTLEAEIKMPFGSVELPKVWIPINGDFAQAVDLVFRCTRKKSPDFAKTCVHIHPKHLEASDNTKMARWTMPTFVQKSVLVRGTTIKAMVPLGMTKACETQNWLHFRNPFGLRVSLRKFPVENYPKLDQFLTIRGQRVTFPKGLADAADRAGIVLDDTDGSVKVSISEDKAVVSGFGMAGEISEEKGIEYSGPAMTFLIPPKLIAELVEQQTSCEVSDVCLRVAGEHYIYLTSLEVQR